MPEQSRAAPARERNLGDGGYAVTGRRARSETPFMR